MLEKKSILQGNTIQSNKTYWQRIKLFQSLFLLWQD